MKRTRLLQWLVGLVLLACALPAWAVDVDLRQSDGTKTPQGGIGNSGNVNLTTCISGESACDNADPNSYVKTTGAVVRSTSIMSGVITNTTSATTGLPTGWKSFNATVDGTGAVTATINVYGANLNSTSNLNNVICTITLSNTTHGEATCPPTSVNFQYYFGVTTNVTGTGATVAATAVY